MKWPFAFALVITLALMPLVHGVDVGVSPAIIDLGEVKRGETKFVTFYVITSYDKDLSVTLETTMGSTDFFVNSKYSYMLPNYSEENTESWVKPITNPVLLKYRPDVSLGQIKNWRNVDLLLRVPEGAEPGVHLVTINPKPMVQEGMVGINSVVPVNIMFTVPGNAVRSGDILDIVSYMTGNTLNINTFFLNNGTVTVRPTSFVEIYNESQFVKRMTQSSGYVKPGEMFQLIAYSDFIPGGRYSIFSNASYITGYSVRNASLRLVSPPTAQVTKAEEAGAFPVWVILIFIAIIIVYIILR